MTRYVFVGERRSMLAIRNGWTWESGRVAAHTLFRALRASGIEPKAHHYMNLYLDPPGPATIQPGHLARLRHMQSTGYVVVALGNPVARDLARSEIPHLKLVHPAARGTIRRRENYAAHVQEVLCVLP